MDTEKEDKVEGILVSGDEYGGHQSYAQREFSVKDHGPWTIVIVLANSPFQVFLFCVVVSYISFTKICKHFKFNCVNLILCCFGIALGPPFRIKHPWQKC